MPWSVSDHHLWGGSSWLSAAIGRPVPRLIPPRIAAAASSQPDRQPSGSAIIMMSTEHTAGLPISARLCATCVPKCRNKRCMRLCCGGLRRLGTAGQRDESWRQRRAARPTARTPIEQRIPVVANIPRLSYPPSDVTTMNVAPAIAGATLYAPASAAGAICRLLRRFVVTPDQEHREAGSCADNHRNAKSGGRGISR